MHAHHHPHHPPAPGSGSATRAFATVTLINLAYTALEAGYGFAINSLALLSDALHNLGDVLGLALAWGAAALAQRPPRGRLSYGWGRATLLSPLANGMLIVGFAGALLWEAVQRLAEPPAVPGTTVIVVAALGIAVNLGAAWFMRQGHAHDLNRRGAYLHLLADAAVSLAAVMAGLGMLLFGWAWLDPGIALLVGVVVAWSAAGLLRESLAAVLDAVPPQLDQAEVHAFLAGLEGVRGVHHLHIWRLAAGRIALTVHLVREPSSDHDAFLRAAAEQLDRRFSINHVTLQVEHGGPCDERRIPG